MNRVPLTVQFGEQVVHFSYRPDDLTAEMYERFANESHNEPVIAMVDLILGLVASWNLDVPLNEKGVMSLPLALCHAMFCVLTEDIDRREVKRGKLDVH